MPVARGSLVLVILLSSLCAPTRARRGGNSAEYTPSSSSSSSPTSTNSSNVRTPWRKDTFLPKDIQVECQELRAKRFISDGHCTSMKPIKEVVCAGNCLPIRQLPWFAEFVKYWSRKKLREFQCEEDVVKRKKVTLLCKDGGYRKYRIKVVKSCKCKRTVDDHNRTKIKDRRRRRRKQRERKKRQRQQQREQQGLRADQPMQQEQPARRDTNV